MSIKYFQGTGDARQEVTSPTNAGSYAVEATLNNANYQGSQSGTLVIDQAAGSISWDTLPTPTYSPDGTFTVSASANSGATVSFEKVSGPCAQVSGGKFSISGAGDCVIKASAPATDNYSAASSRQTVSITKANQTIDFSAIADKTYGDGDFAPGAEASSGLAVSYAASGDCSIVSGKVSITGAGSCTVMASQAGNGNYNAATDVVRSFSIAMATPVLNWSNPADITYGTALGTTQLNATASYNGNSVAGAFAYTPAEGTKLDAGTHTLRADFTPTDTTNYNSAFKMVSITVNKAASTTTVTVANGIYNGEPQGGSAVVTGAGGLNQSLTVSYSGRNGTVYGPSATAPTNAGDYTASASYAGGANHVGSSDAKEFSIAKANATIRVSGDTFTYDGTAKGASGSATGVGGADLSGGLNLGDSFTNAGTHTANWTFNGGTNYNSDSGSVQIVINKRAITVTADPKSKTYGDADPALTYRITSGSLVNDERFSGSIARVAGENAGSYAIQQGTLTATNNYNLTFVDANLTIDRARLSVTADDKSKVYGEANPALTGTLTGVKNNEAISKVFSTSATEASGVGEYAITADVAGATHLLSNYDITRTNGKLTVTERLITVTADNKSKTWGDADPALTYRITSGSLVNDDSLSGSLTRVTGENVGTYAIQKGTLTAGNNYALSFVGANLTINYKYSAKGFYQPIDMNGVVNSVKAGSVVPVKFELFTADASQEIRDTAAVKSIGYKATSCTTSATIDEIETLATSTSALRFDTTGDQFVMNWKTPSVGCYSLTMTTVDGQSITALFKTR